MGTATKRSRGKRKPTPQATAARAARNRKATKTAKAPRPAKAPTGKGASRLIDAKIRLLGDWRGETLAEMRRLIREAEPSIVEEVKWVKPSNPTGVPVWSRNGIVCTGETYNDLVKLTFLRGAALPDPKHLFNASLEGHTRRAIDLRKGETPDAAAFQALVQAAVAANAAGKA